MEQRKTDQNVEQTANYLKFSRLPQRVQERLLARQRGKGAGFAFETAGIGSAYFLSAAAIIWLGLVFYFADDYLWSSFQTIFFGIVSFGAFCLLIYNLYKLFRWFTSRSKCHLLITPHYVIETVFDDVWYWNLDQLNAANGVHRQQDGRYNSTQITLSFENNLKKTFDVKNIEIAEETIEEIYRYKKLFAEATGRNDADYIDSNDDFIELRNETATKKTIGGKNIKYLATAGISAILTAAMMFGAISLNNFYDDVKSWDAAESANRAAAYRTYLQTHSQGRWAKDARENLQDLYDAAAQKYRASLNEGYDQKAVDAVLQALNYAKTTRNYQVKVIFERHNEIPSNIVEELKKQYEVKKIIPFDDTFSEEKMLRREGNLLAVVNNAFRQVIPDDILEFSTECGGECATFLIKYKVGSKDSLYYDPREKKLPDVERTWNPGIFIDWDFDIRTPNQPQTYNFSLASKPADFITYDSSFDENPSGNFDVEKEMKVDKGNLYDAMVASAFDDFKANLVYRMGIGEEPKPKDEDAPENDKDTNDFS